MFYFNFKSLLPKVLNEREAQNFKYPNIKPRFSTRDFKRLIIVSTLTLFLTGVQPSLIFPSNHSIVYATEPTQQETIISALTPEFRLPFAGYLSTQYSNWHPGIDLATGLGTPIHSIATGVVEEINFGVFGYGNDVIITHTDGFKSLYGHMDKIYVKKGAPVSFDTIIGTVGLTGFTSGPHTHLEIYKNGKAINPQTILPEIQRFPSIEHLTPYGGNTGSSSTPIANSIQPRQVRNNPAPTTRPIVVTKPSISLPFETIQAPTNSQLFSLPVN